MDIDYDLLATKLKEKLEGKESQKKLTGQAYWRALRRDKNKLQADYIAPESGAPMVSEEMYEELMTKGINWSIKEREAIRIALAGVQRHNKGK